MVRRQLPQRALYRANRRLRLGCEVLERRRLLAPIYEDDFQLVTATHDTSVGTVDIPIKVDGVQKEMANQIHVFHKVAPAGNDSREVFVLDQHGYGRVRHLDYRQAPGNEDPLGTSIVLGPTLVTTTGYYLRNNLDSINFLSPTQLQPDLRLVAVGSPAVDDLTVLSDVDTQWSIAIPQTTPTGDSAAVDQTKIIIDTQVDFESEVTLAPNNGDAFRTLRFSGSYVAASNTGGLGVPTHDADQWTIFDAAGNRLAAVDLSKTSTAPRNTLLTPVGDSNVNEIRLNQLRPSELNDDPPNVYARLLSSSPPATHVARAFITLNGSIDRNSDNIDAYLNRQLPSNTIANGTSMSWSYEVTAIDGNERQPQAQFLIDKYYQYALSPLPIDQSSPYLPLYRDFNDGGTYSNQVFVNNSDGDPLAGNDSQAFYGRSSFRISPADDVNEPQLIFFPGDQRVRDYSPSATANVLRFAARSDVSSQEIRVDVESATAGNIFFNLPITISNQWQEYSVNLPAGTKPTDIRKVALKPQKVAGQNETVRFDEVRILTNGFDPLRLPQSYVPKYSSVAGSRDAAVFPLYSFTYDSALTVKALVVDGSPAAKTISRNIGLALVAMQRADGSIADRFFSGHVRTSAGDRPQPVAERRLGDNAWAALAFLDLYRLDRSDPEFLTAAKSIRAVPFYV